MKANAKLAKRLAALKPLSPLPRDLRQAVEQGYARLDEYRLNTFMDEQETQSKLVTRAHNALRAIRPITPNDRITLL